MPDLKVEDGLAFKKTKVELEIGEEYIWKLWIIYNISAIIEDSHCKYCSSWRLSQNVRASKTLLLLGKNGISS